MHLNWLFAILIQMNDLERFSEGNLRGPNVSLCAALKPEIRFRSIFESICINNIFFFSCFCSTNSCAPLFIHQWPLAAGRGTATIAAAQAEMVVTVCRPLPDGGWNMRFCLSVVVTPPKKKWNKEMKLTGHSERNRHVSLFFFSEKGSASR